MGVTVGHAPKKTFCDWTQTSQLATATKNSIEEDLDMFVDKRSSAKVPNTGLQAQYLYPLSNIKTNDCICMTFASE